MCKIFTCPCCLNTFFDRCAEAEFESASQCDSTTPLAYDKRCDACKTVIGTIEKLESLVYQAPFLETAGMAGMEDLQDWERNEYAAMLLKDGKGDSRGWESQAESRAERQVLREKVQNMGLAGVEDSRQECQGFDMSLTPHTVEQVCTSIGINKENEKPGQNSQW
ncbi:hypothetical protein LTR70_004533 [Exophiala xenobiotica]|uniref:Uncharacterized protein n=1 Tax=Lithohypha guttulata TaxID=1690604 RepID=A0ABR0KNZ6_9EURO|nr:hypothetical protein LTR24_000463 [Lithohypha guttulata]KAK5320450.1 hypothetical protein LTR70_004533 [Exophiala xenobiotica]